MVIRFTAWAFFFVLSFGCISAYASDWVAQDECQGGVCIVPQVPKVPEVTPVHWISTTVVEASQVQAPVQMQVTTVTVSRQPIRSFFKRLFCRH